MCMGLLCLHLVSNILEFACVCNFITCSRFKFCPNFLLHGNELPFVAPNFRRPKIFVIFVKGHNLESILHYNFCHAMLQCNLFQNHYPGALGLGGTRNSDLSVSQKTI